MLHRQFCKAFWKMDKINILKIGGDIVNEPAKLKQFLVRFSLTSGKKILVHGGGNIATKTCRKMGIETLMREGRRITTGEAMDVMTMVYGGLINKNIVAQLQKLGCDALGLSGADGNSIEATIRPKKPIDYGWVGDICCVNTELLRQLLNARLSPVFCAISHNGKGQLLNTNADSIASALAIALSGTYETALEYAFDKPGVMRHLGQHDSFLDSINENEYRTYKAKGSIYGGMLPKLENSFHALRNGVHHVSIGKTRITQ